MTRHAGNDDPIASILVNFNRELSAGQIAYYVDKARQSYNGKHHPSFRIDRRYLNGDCALFGVSNQFTGLSLRVTTNVRRVGSPYFRLDHERRLYTQAIIEDFAWFPVAPGSLHRLPVGGWNKSIIENVKFFAAVFEHIMKKALPGDMPEVNGIQCQDLLNFPTTEEMQA